MRLDLTKLESAEQRGWEARFNFSLGPCGGGEGTPDLMIGALIVGISVATRVSWMQNGQWPWRSALAFVLSARPPEDDRKSGWAPYSPRLAEELAVVVQQRQAVTK